MTRRPATRRIVRLTPDVLEALGEAGVRCRWCCWWELDAVRRSGLDEDDCAAEKDAWLSVVLREWGSCGRVVFVDDAPVGYVCYAPPGLVPGAAALPTAPVSADAVLLTTAFVAPEYAGGGLGRILVQAMARDLIERGGIRAVEAFGARATPGGCVVSAEFLARVGFKTRRDHPRTPRLRMDLRSALTWRDEVEAALERLVGVVRPPTPALRRDGQRPATHTTPDVG